MHRAERSHIATLALAFTGQSAKALESALAHTDAWGRDILILSPPLGAFGLMAFSGMPNHDQARVDLCKRYAAHFVDEDRWFVSYRDWSHAENGAVKYERDLAQRGFELRRHDANGSHALSHEMFEDGDGEAAERLIADWLPDYDRSGVLHGHITRRSVLAALESDDLEQALEIYAEHVPASVTQGLPVTVISDTASFLWRMQASGYTVPAGLWEAAQAYSAKDLAKAGFAFVDAHMGLLAAEIGDRAAAAARIEALIEFVAAGTMTAGPVVPELCRGVLAFA